MRDCGNCPLSGAPPAPGIRREQTGAPPRPKPDRRRALQLLGAAADGYTDTFGMIYVRLQA